MGNSTSSRDRRRTFEAAPPPYSTSEVKTRHLAGTPAYGAWAGDRKEARQSVESLDIAEASDAALHTLKDYDIMFIVDDSSSMKNDRWNRTRQALSGLVDAVNKYTPNGVDIVFINSKVEGRGLKTVDDVVNTFQSVSPTYGTPLGKRLDEVLSEYTHRLQESRKPVRSSIFRTVLPNPTVRPVNYLVITDGDPTDDPLDVIVRNAKWLDENRFPLSQVGIQFVQIGRNRKAKEYLRKLDDDISNENQIRDMIDTYPYDTLGGVLNEEVLKNILLGGINRKEDNAH